MILIETPTHNENILFSMFNIPARILFIGDAFISFRVSTRTLRILATIPNMQTAILIYPCFLEYDFPQILRLWHIGSDTFNGTPYVEFPSIPVVDVLPVIILCKPSYTFSQNISKLNVIAIITFLPL